MIQFFLCPSIIQWSSFSKPLSCHLLSLFLMAIGRFIIFEGKINFFCLFVSIFLLLSFAHGVITIVFTLRVRCSPPWPTQLKEYQILGYSMRKIMDKIQKWSIGREEETLSVPGEFNFLLSAYSGLQTQ